MAGNINPVVYYQQVLSTALEQRSSMWQDIVSDAIPLFDVLRRKGLWEEYSGPRIRQTLLIDLPPTQWYSGYDYLANPPRELFNDAYFTPKMCVTPISLTNQEVLNNAGRNQIFDIVTEYIQAAETGLAEGMDAAMYSDGTGDGGKELGGLGIAVPIVNDDGVYGGISRVDQPIWQPGSYNANSDFPTIGTQVNSVTIRPMLLRIMGQHTRGRRSPDLLLMSPEHFEAYDAATVAIQRLRREDGSGVGRLGFRTLEYIGAGQTSEIVYGGGYGSNMPANTTFGLETGSFRLRYNPQRNFDTLFRGDGMMPINQDAMAQYVGWMGEMTMTNPRFAFRLYDSAP
jgi:hypothetical protein